MLLRAGAGSLTAQLAGHPAAGEFLLSCALTACTSLRGHGGSLALSAWAPWDPRPCAGGLALRGTASPEGSRIHPPLSGSGPPNRLASPKYPRGLRCSSPLLILEKSIPATGRAACLLTRHWGATVGAGAVLPFQLQADVLPCPGGRGPGTPPKQRPGSSPGQAAAGQSRAGEGLQGGEGSFSERGARRLLQKRVCVRVWSRGPAGSGGGLAVS